MAGVKHTFSVNIADDASAQAAGQVLPSHWNAEHTLSGVAEQSALDVTSAAVAAVSAAHTSLVNRVSANSALAGGGSVTSAEVVDAVSVEAANRVSADNVISAAVAVVSAAHTSLAGAVSVNSAQMVSADNAISNAVSIVSAAVVSTNNRISGVSADLASVQARVSVNSGQMTSADNAISAAVAAVSAAHTSLVSDVGRISGVVSVNTSAIAANSAQMTSAHNALSQRMSALVLNSLADVSISTPATSGQVLMWNATSSKWFNSAIPGGAGSVTSAEAQQISADAASGNALLSLRIDSAQGANSNYASVASNAASVASNAASVASNAASVAVQAASVASAAAVAGGFPTKQVLGGDQIVSATAPVSISGFTFTVSAGVGYGFEFGIFRSAPISLAGTKLVLSCPAGPVAGQYLVGGAVGGISTFNFDNTNVTMAQVTVSAVGVCRAVMLRGTFLCSTAGTIALAIGNNVSGGAAGSSITVRAGSYGYVWRMV